ncbi:MAG: hypothetical protein V4618_15605 [Pseudomonadota bacterium]
MSVLLPIITNVSITGYQLYPGRRQQGIDWPVLKGVSVIAGVNGLGKTTLLNILFRLLAGPVDWHVAEGAALGNLPHELRPIGDPSYFRARVADGAARATAAAEIRFGSTRIEIRRRLKDLSIEHLVVNGRVLDHRESTYREVVRTASGIASDFDFHMVLRLVVFYLEDRRSLIWDRSAQDEILRALFYPQNIAVRVASVGDQVQSLDSQFRNQRVFLKRQEGELASAEAAVAANSASRTAYSSAQTRLRALRERENELDEELVTAERERTESRNRVERARLDIEEQRRRHHDLRHRFFSTLFPGIGQVGTYLLVNLDGGAGCLVCGNRAEEAAKRLDVCVAEGICPLCDAPAERHDVRPIRVSARESEALIRVEQDIETAQQQLQDFETARDAAGERYWGLFEEQVRAREQRSDIERELDALRRMLPPPDETIEALRRVVSDLRRDQNELTAKRKVLEIGLRSDLEAGHRAVMAVADKIAQRFTDNAAAFLAEQCEITVVQENRRFGGETDVFQMPRFRVSLTSGVFKAQAQPRQGDREVSESQKEFIDLAFRLALLQTVSGNRPAMLVIETPEASLDSLFIARAGSLLGKFARGGGRIGNRLIASSNLNKEDMIPALFGLASEEEYIAWWARRRTGAPAASEHAVSVAERRKRMLNLLDEAAENRAVERYRDGYVLRYRRALDPEWSHPPMRPVGSRKKT